MLDCGSAANAVAKLVGEHIIGTVTDAFPRFSVILQTALVASPWLVSLLGLNTGSGEPVCIWNLIILTK